MRLRGVARLLRREREREKREALHQHLLHKQTSYVCCTIGQWLAIQGITASSSVFSLTLLVYLSQQCLSSNEYYDQFFSRTSREGVSVKSCSVIIIFFFLFFPKPPAFRRSVVLVFLPGIRISRWRSRSHLAETKMKNRSPKKEISNSSPNALWE